MSAWRARVRRPGAAVPRPPAGAQLRHRGQPGHHRTRRCGTVTRLIAPRYVIKRKTAAATATRSRRIFRGPNPPDTNPPSAKSWPSSCRLGREDVMSLPVGAGQCSLSVTAHDQGMPNIPPMGLGWPLMPFGDTTVLSHSGASPGGWHFWPWCQDTTLSSLRSATTRGRWRCMTRSCCGWFASTLASRFQIGCRPRPRRGSRSLRGDVPVEPATCRRERRGRPARGNNDLRTIRRQPATDLYRIFRRLGPCPAAALRIDWQGPLRPRGDAP